MVACVEEDSVRLARSHCVRRRRIARWLPAMSLPRFLRLGCQALATETERKCANIRCMQCHVNTSQPERLEVLDAEVHYAVVEVLTAQVGVAGSGLCFNR